MSSPASGGATAVDPFGLAQEASSIAVRPMAIGAQYRDMAGSLGKGGTPSSACTFDVGACGFL
jgi:hypothetical protein